MIRQLTPRYIIIHFNLQLIVFSTAHPRSRRYTHTVERVSRESVLTRAGIIAGRVVAHGIVATCAWYRTLIHILTVHLTVTDVTGFALAEEVRG